VTKSTRKKFSQSWVFDILKRDSTITPNEQIIRHNICNLELQRIYLLIKCFYLIFKNYLIQEYKYMKNFLKKILLNVSKVIYFIIPDDFKPSLKSKLLEDLLDETLNHFKEPIKQSIIFTNHWKIREYAIKTALLNDKHKEYYYLEFGTFEGESANFFSKFINKLYCFDSFEGLMEDWSGTSLPKGHFNLNKKIPKLNSNIEPIVGWVDDTLENFLKKHNPKINFLHMDMDTYSPTKFILEKLKPYLVKDAIILFDELYNYHGWRNGEYKALTEVFKEDEFNYKAFTINSDKCAIQIK
tara:strand:- start:294 stop:1187 length:894 start_codon:yes stop_codon:yes gene_type:complete